jgi:predicted nucleotidyltransferase
MKLKDKYTVEYIESNDLVIFKTLIGSYSQNLQTENSDKDYYGVFRIKSEDYNSLEYRLNPFDTVISNSKDNDVTYIEIGKFIELLYKNNPNALEMLASAKTEGNYTIITNWVDLFDMNQILSKKCLDTFGKYATSQIKKATGLNKKMNNPIPVKKKSILDFCYFYSNNNPKPVKIIKYLQDNNIDQKFIGLRGLKNCKSTYEVFVDNHSLKFFTEDRSKTLKEFFYNISAESCELLYEAHKRSTKFAKFKGIVHPDKLSNQLRLSSIPKIPYESKRYDIEQLGFMYYNLEGYETYLKDYREYHEWIEKRNPERHKNNIGQKYDVKNLAHCARLLTMCKEIAENKGIILKRTDDRYFFLNIKLGKVNYEDILNYTENIINLLPDLYKESQLRDLPDFNHLNNILTKIR